MIRKILLSGVAAGLLSLSPAPAQAWFPGQHAFQAARNFAANRAENVRRRSGNRQQRRADGRGLGRFGVGDQSGNGYSVGYFRGGGCANGSCSR